MTIRIATGTTDQVVYFDAGVSGLSSFTVYRARNGGAATQMTTPTVTEVDATNMSGVYALTLDEDMDVAASNLTEAMVFYISAAGMTPQTVQIELFDPSDYTVGLLTATQASIDAIEADTNELQGDWTDGGRLDLLIDNMGTDTDNIVADTNELQTDWTNAGRLDTIIDAIKAKTDSLTFTVAGEVDANALSINGSGAAATQLALSAAQIENGACEGTPTTTVIQTNLAETQDDIYIGRVVIFTSGDARGEATDITDYTGSTGTLTVTALANAPAATDTFILI